MKARDLAHKRTSAESVLVLARKITRQEAAKQSAGSFRRFTQTQKATNEPLQSKVAL
jgi:hypothetical protein